MIAKPTKYQLISNLHQLVSKNVIGDKALMSRYKGFRAELFFEEYLHELNSVKTLEGGNIFSIDNTETSLENAIYITVIDEHQELSEYERLYLRLRQIGFRSMYLIQYDSSFWQKRIVMEFPNEKISMPLPLYKVYEFEYDSSRINEIEASIKDLRADFKVRSQRNANKYPIKDSSLDWIVTNLIGFDYSLILKIFMNRLIFDGLIGFAVEKGMSSDIDLITTDSMNEFNLIEIKEKDLPKFHDKGFGIDVPRIRDFYKIQKMTGLKYHIVIRHINNQQDRNLIDWKFIEVNDFIDNVKQKAKVEGGQGMNTKGTSKPTLICDYNKFQNKPTF